MSRQKFEDEARLLLAARLFEIKRVTSGHAAEMAGISRSEFLLQSGRFRFESAMPAADEIAEDIGET